MKRAVLTVKETKRDNNAGPKAKMDIEKFLVDNGFVKWNFTINQKSILQKARVAYLDIPNFFNKNENQKIDEVFLQYPTYSKIVTKQLIKRLKKLNSKVFLIVHDVESLRLHYGEENYIREELDMFNLVDGLIIHNEKMAQWLKENGVNVPMESLEVFDYDNPNPLVNNDEYRKSVCFAGNLTKAGFLQNLSLKEVSLNIFGPNPADKYGQNISYQGQYSPEDLSNHLNDNFGLVWDGTTPTTCDGIFGNYMKYNNPHKASLYLSSGIPVVIWRKAALSKFIEENNLGIAVDSLTELDEVLSKMSLSKYENLLKNVRDVSQKLKKGFFIEKAIQNLENTVSENK